MSPKPVALILGAGANVGAATASSFSSLGYQVATASRSGTNSIAPDTGILSLQADLTNPSSIPPLFTRIRSELHTAPSVVVYNPAALTPPPDKDSVLSVPTDRFVSDFNVNSVSPYVAAQEAVRAWGESGTAAGATKTFIYTGNMLNVTILPVGNLLTLGVGKSASAYWVGLADTLYKAKGYRFFYADQRQEDGSPIGQAIDGPAHGDFYAQLAQGAKDVPWLATFVKGKGYVKF